MKKTPWNVGNTSAAPAASEKSFSVLPLDEAIKAGHVERATAVRRIDAKKSPTGNDLIEHYERLKANDLLGILSIAASDIDEKYGRTPELVARAEQLAVRLFNLQWDTRKKQSLGYKLRNTATKPKRTKAKVLSIVQKAAEDLVQSGAAKTVEEAKRMLFADSSPTSAAPRAAKKVRH